MLSRLNLLEMKIIYSYILKVEIDPFLSYSDYTYLNLTSDSYYTFVREPGKVVSLDNLPKMLALRTDENYTNRIEYIPRGVGGFRFKRFEGGVFRPELSISFWLENNFQIPCMDSNGGGCDERKIMKIALMIIINLLWFIWNLDERSIKDVDLEWEEIVKRLNVKLHGYGRKFWKSVKGYLTEASTLGRLL